MVLSITNLAIIGLAISSGLCYLVAVGILSSRGTPRNEILVKVLQISLNMVNPILTFFWYTLSQQVDDKNNSDVLMIVFNLTLSCVFWYLSTVLFDYLLNMRRFVAPNPELNSTLKDLPKI